MNKSSNKPYVLGAIGLAVLIALVIIGMNTFNKQPQVANIATPGITATLSLINPSNGTVQVGDMQHIGWTSTNYVAPKVSVNIIRKVSNNPATYTLVRTVASATTNDGSAVWVPAKTDVGTDTFVQVGCVNSTQACVASPVSGSNALAVIDTGTYSNTAAAYQAIEMLNNK